MIVLVLFNCDHLYDVLYSLRLHGALIICLHTYCSSAAVQFDCIFALQYWTVTVFLQFFINIPVTYFESAIFVREKITRRDNCYIYIVCCCQIANNIVLQIFWLQCHTSKGCFALV